MMPGRVLPIGHAVVAVVFAGRAGASNSGFGPACHQAAAFGWPLRQSLEICRQPLRDRSLSPRARGATLVDRGIVERHGKRYAAAVADFDAALVVVPGLPVARERGGRVDGAESAPSVTPTPRAWSARPARR